MRLAEEKADKIAHKDDLEMLWLWLEEVKRIDNKMRFYRNDVVCEFKASSAAHCYGQCAQHDANLSPSTNIISSSSNQPKCINPPTMTDDEQCLLKENKGCYICHKPFAGHLTSDKDCDFPSPLNYIPVMQTLITSLKRAYQNKKHVASVTITHGELSASVGQENVMHPIMALILGVPNPVAYHTSNLMTMVEDLEASNTSVVSVQVVLDSFNVVGTFIENIKSPFDAMPDKKVNLVKTSMISAPFTVLHLFWRASVAP